MKAPDPTLLFLILLIISCSGDRNNTQPSFKSIIQQHLDTTISVYEQYAVVNLPIKDGPTIHNPGAIEVGPDNKIFVANLTGEIYSLHDSNDDGLEDKSILFCDVTKDGYRTPTSIAFKDWDLYVGLPQQIRVYRDLDEDFQADTSFTFFEDIPFSDHPYEYTTGMRFDTAGWLYFALATDSWNVGASPDPKRFRGSILKVAPDGREAEVAATGIRSVFGMDFDKDGNLFFTDNQGGQNPNEELHLLDKGSFYGHNTSKFGANLPIREPIATLHYEVAPSEMQFFSQNGLEYLFLVYYGPGEYWTRGSINKIHLSRTSDQTFQIEESPIANIPKIGGIAINEGGNIYVTSVGKTDYWYFATAQEAGSIYRLIPQDWIIPDPTINDSSTVEALSESSIEKGKFLFAARACSSCHSIDGKSEMLGPDLRNISRVYSRDELLEEIRDPSKRLKPGDFPTKVTTKDDQVFLGRLLTQNEDEIKLILIGNIVKTISTSHIKSSEQLTQSLMYPGLLTGLSEDETNSLLDYLSSLENI